MSEQRSRTNRTLQWGLVVVLAGIGAGLVGVVMTLALHLVQWLTWGTHGASLVDQVRAAPRWRRLLGPAVGGLLAGLGWWWLRRRGPVTTIEQAIETGRPLPPVRTWVDALLQILVVGAGASIGREGAPRQAAAAVADQLSKRFRTSSRQRHALMAAGAGAGLAAVYNIPVAGLFFALELFGLPRRWRAVLAGAVISVVATATAWVVVPPRPLFGFPATPTTVSTLVSSTLWALACIPVCAALASGFDALATRAKDARTPPGWRLPAGLALVAALTGLAAWWLPSLPGNGKDVMGEALLGHGGIALLLVLVVAKPLFSVLTLRSGAVGGLLMPSLSTGAALGAAVALLLAQAGQPAPVAVFALLAAAGVLAVTQRAPLFAAAMAWELTWAPWWTIPLLLAVTVGAHRLRSWHGTPSHRR